MPDESMMNINVYSGDGQTLLASESYTVYPTVLTFFTNPPGIQVFRNALGTTFIEVPVPENQTLIGFSSSPHALTPDAMSEVSRGTGISDAGTYNYYMVLDYASAPYEYVMHDGNMIQVESAIRDEEGYRIATSYPKKIDIRCKPAAGQRTVVIHHGLNNAPSAVLLYLVHHTTPESYEKIETDISVTATDIILNFIELPTVPADARELELLVRSLI